MKCARVWVLGAGGIGSSLLPYLVSSGIGHIRLFDADRVERSNLARQVLFCEADIGRLKGEVARQRLAKINPFVEIIWEDRFFDPQSEDLLPQDHHFILEGTDSIETKFLTNDLTLKNNIPALIGGLGADQGHIFPISRQSDHACYRCLFEAPPSNELPGCSSEGILSPLPGVIGSMMAYLTVMYFIEKKLDHHIFLLEKNNWRKVAVNKDSDCRYCNRI